MGICQRESSVKNGKLERNTGKLYKENFREKFRHIAHSFIRLRKIPKFYLI